MPAPESTQSVLAQLIDEWQDRLRRGERPNEEDYAKQYPELAEEIRELLPGLAAIENLKGDALDHTVAPTAAYGTVAEEPVVERMGDFRILRKVGQGGMGVVYEAEQVSLGRRVALKVLPQKVMFDSRQKRRFEREAKAAAKLHHTNIVPVFGVGDYEGMPYYVMQFIQGLGLEAVVEEVRLLRCGPEAAAVPGASPTVSRRDVSAADVARSLVTGEFCGAPESGPDAGVESGPVETGPKRPVTASSITTLGSGAFAANSTTLAGSSKGVPRPGRQTYWQSVAGIGAQVADALQYAHAQGILHRDIKPSNLLLDTRGTVWVADFGLAKAIDSQDDLTHTGDILGTIRYMPPESFEGKGDARGDIYSLGLTLYEMLALRPAFNEKVRHQLVKTVTSTEPERLGRLNPAIPRDLATIVHKAIEREPGRRYQTARELGADLERFLANEPILARRTGPWERAIRWVRKKPAAAALVAVSMVAGMAVIAAVTVLMYNAKLQEAKLTAEQARSEAEAARDGEVDQRQQAEEQRQQAEAARNEALLQRGEALRQSAMADAARAEAEKQRGIAEGARQNAILQRGLLAVLTRQWQEAANDLGTYTKTHPDDLKAWLALARTQAMLGKPAIAIEAYSHAIALAPEARQLDSLVEGLIGRAEQSAVNGQRAAAIADYERAFKLKPAQPDQAAAFAQVLYDDAAGWQVLTPALLTAKNGALHLMPDGSVVPVGVNPTGEIKIETSTDLAGVRAIRLELLGSRKDDSEYDRDGRLVALTTARSGRNFSLSEFTVAAAAANEPSRPIRLVRAWSNYRYTQQIYQNTPKLKLLGHVSAAIDGDPATCWYIHSPINLQRLQLAVFSSAEPMTGPGGGKLIIRLQFPTSLPAYQSGGIGRFRLSACVSPPEPATECLVRSSSLSGWLTLALARAFRGESAAATDALDWADPSQGEDTERQLVRVIVGNQQSQNSELIAAYEKINEEQKQLNPYGGYVNSSNDQTLRWLAVQAMSTVVKREPENAALRRYRADALNFLEEWAAALADYHELIRADPKDFRTLLDRGACLAQLARADEAAADFAAASRINPEATLAAHQQQLTALMWKDPRAALIHLNAALVLERGRTGEVELLAKRSGLFSQLGRRAEAVADVTRALELNPNSAEALLERGGLRMDVGERADALADFAAARKLNPSEAMRWHQSRLTTRQIEYGQKPNYDLTVIHLTEIIESDSNISNRMSYLQRRASANRGQKRWREAAADYERLVEAYPSAVYYLAELAECFAQAGDMAKAALNLDQALKVERDQALLSIRQKLMMLENAHSWAVAEAFLNACLRLKLPPADEIEFVRRRATVRLEMGQYATALADSERLVELQPSGNEALRLMARCLIAHGDALAANGKTREAAETRRRARDQFEKLHASRPNHEPTALSLAELLLADAADWNLLDLQRLKSAGGARLERQPDGSVLASGPNPVADAYLVRGHTNVAAIRAIRLEALPDDSLPLNGPGRNSNGNFLLSEVEVRSSLTGPQPIPIREAAASAERWSADFFHPVANAIDGRRGTKWSIQQTTGQPQTIGQKQSAVFTLREPLADGVEGVDLAVSLEFGAGASGEATTNLGRFRLSVSASSSCMLAEQIRWSSANSLVKLAAARVLTGDREAALAVLRRLENRAQGADPATLVLTAWVWREVDPNGSRPARDRFVEWVRKRTDAAPLPLPSIAADVLTRAATETAELGSICLWLARTLDHLGDARGASDAYRRAIRAQPSAREYCLESGKFHLRRSDWIAAAADFRHAMDLEPNDHYLWFQTAPLYLWAGDAEGYRRHRDAMLARFGRTTDNVQGERTAKVCALAPLAAETGALLVALSQRAVDSGSKYESWSRLAHALALYRASRSEAAIEQARRAVRPDAPDRSAYVDAPAALIEALALHQLGKTEDARRRLAAAEEIMARDLPDVTQENPDASYPDLLVCLLLRREALATIAPEALPRAPAPRRALRFKEEY